MKFAGVATAPGPNRFVRTMGVAHDAARGDADGSRRCRVRDQVGAFGCGDERRDRRARAGEGGAGDPDDAVDLRGLAVRAPDQRARVGIRRRR